jgi:hypothetical protein
MAENAANYRSWFSGAKAEGWRRVHRWAKDAAALAVSPFILDGRMIGGSTLQRIEMRADRWKPRWLSRANAASERRQVALVLAEAVLATERPPPLPLSCSCATS